MAKHNKGTFIAGVALGAIIAPITAFSVGWIVTSGAADAAARNAANEAVVNSLTPICVSQFSKDNADGEQLAKLKATSKWSRAEFVAESGWATMPGSDSANGLVASECARRLADLEK